MAKKRGAGEGTIHKRKHGKGNSLWCAVVTVGYDENNKRIRKTFYGPTRQVVAEKLNDVITQTKQGTFREPSKMPISEWLDTWLNDYMKHSLRATTFESYEVQVRKHLKPSIGAVRLHQLTTAHLQKLYNEKLTAGRADGKQGGLSVKSIRYLHGVIYGALEQAKKEGMIIINPSDSVKLPKLEKPDVKFFDSEQVSAFLQAAQNTPYFTAYYLELATGLRRGELLGLRWCDVDLELKIVSVNQGLVRTKAGLVFQPPKTKHGKRTISIPSHVAGVLKFHKKRQENLQEEAGSAWVKEMTFLNKDKPEDNDLVFTNAIGKPVDPRALTRHFERLIDNYNKQVEKEGKLKNLKAADIEKAKITKISFHGLRHTFATLSLQQGVDMRTTSENLGHFDPGFTLSVYSGVTARMKQEATDKIGNLLSDCLKS
jgi:integrase